MTTNWGHTALDGVGLGGRGCGGRGGCSYGKITKKQNVFKGRIKARGSRGGACIARPCTFEQMVCHQSSKKVGRRRSFVFLATLGVVLFVCGTVALPTGGCIENVYKLAGKMFNVLLGMGLFTANLCHAGIATFRNLVHQSLKLQVLKVAYLEGHLGKAKVTTFLCKGIDGGPRKAVVAKWWDLSASRGAIESDCQGLHHNTMADRVEAAGAKGVNDRIQGSINLLGVNCDPCLRA